MRARTRWWRTVRRTRRAVGADIQIMVDVHKRWQPRLAVHTARRMEEYDVTWLEGARGVG